MDYITFRTRYQATNSRRRPRVGGRSQWNPNQGIPGFGPPDMHGGIGPGAAMIGTPAGRGISTRTGGRERAPSWGSATPSPFGGGGWGALRDRGGLFGPARPGWTQHPGPLRRPPADIVDELNTTIEPEVLEALREAGRFKIEVTGRGKASAALVGTGAGATHGVTLDGDYVQIFQQSVELDPDSFTDLQKKLYNAGLYDPAMYEAGQEPVYGSYVNDPGFTKALAEALRLAAVTGRSVNDVLDEKAQGFAPQLAASRANAAAQDQVLIDNPLHIISLTPTDTIVSVTDRVAQQILGRNATDKERLLLAQSVNAIERLRGTQTANVAHENALGEAMAGAGLGGFNVTGAMGEAGGGAIINPLGGRQSTMRNNFGEDRGDHAHGGIDMGAQMGTPIMAAQGGRVTLVKGGGYNGGAGNYIEIAGADGRKYRYLHLSNQDFGMVRVGQTVQQGQVIGRVGSTGRSSGPHLHFEIHQNGQKIDPYPEVSGARSVQNAGGQASPTGGGDVQAWMRATRQVESNNNYDWGLTSSAGAKGAYQFLPSTWVNYARAAGRNPNDKSAANQDAVAAHAAQRLYNKYGSWKMVAIAWHGGEGTADAFMANPTRARSRNPKTARYADTVAGLMEQYGGGMASDLNNAGAIGTTDYGLRTQEQQTFTETDMAAYLEQEFRRRNPDEAVAHDTALQVDVLQQLVGEAAT